MMRLSVLIGWALVVAVGVLFHSNHMGILLAAIIAAASALLLLDSEFPNRSSALGMSWVGPLLLVSNRAISVAAASATSNGTALNIIAQGFLLTLAMVWLWRGYGLVLLLAIPARLMPQRNRASIEKAAREYPWRWWWLLPIGTALLSLGIAFDIYHVTRN